MMNKYPVRYPTGYNNRSKCQGCVYISNYKYGVVEEKGDEKKNIKILNDSRHPFGHGYCLAMALKESI